MAYQTGRGSGPSGGFEPPVGRDSSWESPPLGGLDLFIEAPIPYLVLDADGVIRRANRAARQLLTNDEEPLEGASLACLLADESLLCFDEHLRAGDDPADEASSPHDVPHEVELSLADGRIVEVLSRRAAPGGPWLSSLQDVSEERLSARRLQTMAGQLRVTNARLAELAHVDPLTRQGNRRAITRALVKESARMQRSGSNLQAVLIDCDDFKQINDSYGHATGDIVLQAVAQRLHRALRPTDHLGRIGGDEFLVLLPETSYAEGQRIAERLREAVAHMPIDIAEGIVRLTASIGLAALPPTAVGLDEVLSLTGLSLKRSKRQGKNRVSTSERPTPPALLRSRFEALEQLREGRGLRAVCQPIVGLDDRSVVGFELLSRSNAPDFEMPRDFLSAAEGSAALAEIDLHCLRTCVDAASRLPGVRKHLNLLPSTLLAQPTNVLLDVLLSRGAGQDYCIELSEQQMIGDPLALRRPVQALREAGVSIAIDDVGFGKSSLEALILLEPTVVKIDRRFTRGAVEVPGSRQSLARLVNVLRALDVMPVAMGIEASDELEAVDTLGVAAGQGYLLGLPGRLDAWARESAEHIGASSSTMN